MRIDLVIWIVLPLLLGAAMCIVSIACAWKNSSVGHCLTSLIVLAGVAWSSYVLVAIARGAWPTFVPHIVLAAILSIVGGQVAQTVIKDE